MLLYLKGLDGSAEKWWPTMREHYIMSDHSELYDKFLERYAEGSIPWDDPLPPPEVIALGVELPPGRALDLGCGYGRTAIYLAARGWSADGVDFIAHAVEIARARATAAGGGERARFYQASVAELGFLEPPYDLAVDVGCMHSFDEETLRAYAAELVRLLRPGGRFLLFVHLRDAADEDPEDVRGIEERSLMAQLGDDFQLDRVEYGLTRVGDNPSWNSAWYWFRRR